MIVYGVKPGEAPGRLYWVPGANVVFAWLRESGYRAVWIMVDEGVEADKPKPCCYGSSGE